LERAVYGLVADVSWATRIAKACKACHVTVRNSDKAESLLRDAQAQAPVLFILDWDHCEAEAFKLLKGLADDALTGKIPAVGFSGSKRDDLKQEAMKAGCLRVYGRSEFSRDIETILARYVI